MASIHAVETSLREYLKTARDQGVVLITNTTRLYHNNKLIGCCALGAVSDVPGTSYTQVVEGVFRHFKISLQDAAWIVHGWDGLKVREMKPSPWYGLGVRLRKEFQPMHYLKLKIGGRDA